MSQANASSAYNQRRMNIPNIMGEVNEEEQPPPSDSIEDKEGGQLSDYGAPDFNKISQNNYAGLQGGQQMQVADMEFTEDESSPEISRTDAISQS